MASERSYSKLALLAAILRRLHDLSGLTPCTEALHGLTIENRVDEYLVVALLFVVAFEYLPLSSIGRGGG